MTANATAILTRRVKQGVAEWYVRDLVEKSRRGMEESVPRLAHRRPGAIEELSARRGAITERLRDLERAHVAAPPQPREIEALLDTIPDLRGILARATPEDLRALLGALDFKVTYELAATLTPELVLNAEQLCQQSLSRVPVGDIFHSGGRI